MVKKTKRNKKPQNKTEKENNQNIPISLPFNKISTIKSIHDKTLTFLLLSKTNKYIIACSASYLSLLDKNNFNVLSKYKIYDPILFLIELNNNRIILSNAKMIFVFEVENNKLNLLFHYEETNFEKMGIIGLSQINDDNILMISPRELKYYKQDKINILELYETFNIGNLIELQYEDYGTQFKSAFLLNNNNDFIALLTRQEMFIIKQVNKTLVKKINLENTSVLFKYLNLEKEVTLIYHKKKLILFNNKHLEIINQSKISNKEEEITCIEKLKKEKCLIYGTNIGIIYIYNYQTAEIIKKIKFECGAFNITWIKEIDNNIIINNLPKSEIGLSNYDTGDLIGKLNLKNSSNFRKGVFIEESKKLLLGCANNFALLE